MFSDKNIDKLIKSLKQPTKLFILNDISQEVSSLIGSVDVDERVIGIADDIEYKLVIIRGPRDINRYSIHLRFKENNIHLIRVDIGGGHRYPDGTRLNEPHVHFISDPFNQTNKEVVTLKEANFPNVDTILDAFEAFICYTNIKEKTK
ncbi:hypothetical protein BKP56_09070 [Marinilactibacillus sp. 15R]|nr:hypothetical protein BKP56_09070 [Marinilactibacillus sp. 15R]